MSAVWPAPEVTPDHPLIGESAIMRDLRAALAEIGRSEASVLINGPSGSGKELAARSVHAASSRASGPFIAVNCGAIPRELLESELFGHEKGAFTGAHSTRVGRFEAAAGGTLFLDEIGDMPLDMQVALLRVLEERRFERVGGNRPITADVRIVSATHRDLARAVEEGKFREDLYYRLAVVPVIMPALAERAADVPLLLNHFAARLGDRAPRFAPDGLAALMAHDWPGNVRELRNFIERAAVRCGGRAMGAADVEAALVRRSAAGGIERAGLNAGRAAIRAPAPSIQVFPGVDPAELLAAGTFDLRAALGDLEQRFIQAALAHSGDIVADAARRLGLQRTTLVEKMRRLGLSRGAEAVAC